jgi:hypothetical protein
MGKIKIYEFFKPNGETDLKKIREIKFEKRVIKMMKNSFLAHSHVLSRRKYTKPSLGF